MRPLPHPNKHQLFADLDDAKQLLIVRLLVKAHDLSRVYSSWHARSYDDCDIVSCKAEHPSGRQWHRWRNAHTQILDYIETTTY